MTEGQLDQDQARALDVATQKKVLIVTGGPGTGKTFTINALLDHLGPAPEDYALAAPTGKAAKRMSEASEGRPARTVHRLLEYSPRLKAFQRNRTMPLEESLIIIDEASMIDVYLMDSLLAALRDDVKLVLVGDKDQLPPVGPGNVLRDLIASGRVPVVELTHIHRQSEHSWISINAQRINQGIPPEEDPLSEDFFIARASEPEEAHELVVELIVEHIPERFGIPSDKIQLLCPQKKGVLGVEELNQRLKDLLNPKDNGHQSFQGFQEGDKVIHVRNNYELEVFNGECGQVSAVDKAAKKVWVDYGDREVCYRGAYLDDLTLSYALTIHKSQGSEWPAVVLPIHSTHYYMLSRNLFYTGVTRGKALVYVVANRKGLARAVKNDGAKQRHTRLEAFLRQNRP